MSQFLQFTAHTNSSSRHLWGTLACAVICRKFTLTLPNANSPLPEHKIGVFVLGFSILAGNYWTWSVVQRGGARRGTYLLTIMAMNYSGLIIAVITFLVIGLFHPVVIKGEYYFGTKCWWFFALCGVGFIVASLLVEHSILSPVLGVVGCSCLWSILELFEQRERVKKGWFPMNPKRKEEYKD